MVDLWSRRVILLRGSLWGGIGKKEKNVVDPCPDLEGFPVFLCESLYNPILHVVKYRLYKRARSAAVYGPGVHPVNIYKPE